MTNDEYRLVLSEIISSLPSILGGECKSIWLFDIANGKSSAHDRDLALDASSKSSSLSLKIITLLKYIVRFFILHIIFGEPSKKHSKAYIGYLVDVDDHGISNHLRKEDIREYDIFYWYISSANSLKNLLKKRLNSEWVANTRILECYCPKWSFFKNLIRSVFVFYSIPRRYRCYSSYMTTFDVLNKIESIEALTSLGYRCVKYLSEQYVWEDILTSLSKGSLVTEAYCHNLAGPDDLKLNNLFCYMTQADKYYIKYSAHQIMLSGIAANVEVIDVLTKPSMSIISPEINGFVVFGHFSIQSNRLSIDIANELAENYDVFFKPHPSGKYDGISRNVTVTKNMADLDGLVNICFFPTKMLDYCFEHSIPTLIFYNNRFDYTAKFLGKLDIPFATYSDIKDGDFLHFIDADGSGLRGLYAK